jgi:hypothetical protein
MKSRRRRTIQKSKTPKDIADQYLELQELRAKVSKAERATAQSKAVSVENKISRCENARGREFYRSRINRRRRHQA